MLSKYLTISSNSLAEWLIKNKSGRIGKGSGRGEVTADEVTHLLEGVKMTDVPGLEEAHKEGLQESTLGGAITEGGFTGDDGRAEGTFGMIIIRGDEWIGQTGEEVVAVSAEAFLQAADIRVRGREGNNIIEGTMEEKDAGMEYGEGHGVTSTMEVKDKANPAS